MIVYFFITILEGGNNDIQKKFMQLFQLLPDNDNFFRSINQTFDKDIFFGNLYEQMGFYKHAFNLTVYYLSILDKETKDNKKSLKDFYTDMIYDISDFGGDTDTNGAIVGIVLGPLIGMENFERKYSEKKRRKRKNTKTT